MATEILSDSGPVLAVPMGSECFLPLWNAREHPCNVSTGSATPQQSQPSHTGKGSPLSACVRAGRGRKVLQLLEITQARFFRQGALRAARFSFAVHKQT